MLLEITEDKAYLESLMNKLSSHKHVVSSSCYKMAEREAREKEIITVYWTYSTKFSRTTNSIANILVNKHLKKVATSS